MKKFDRLPPEKRKEEIQAAALSLFNVKGFAATTMENIVEQVSLSKGGVYRIYPSTSAILSDLMLSGMRLRNSFYEERVRNEISAGRALSLEFIAEMIVESLLIYPEFSKVYAEFLWEKQRRPELEALYREVCSESVQETVSLIEQYGAGSLLSDSGEVLERLTEIMNGAILSMHVLKLQDFYAAHKEQISAAIIDILKF